MRLNRYFRNTKTGVTSKKFLDCVSGTVTLPKNWAFNIGPIEGIKTCVAEIENIPAMNTLPEMYKELNKIKVNSVSISWDKFVDKSWQAFLKALKSTWSSEKFHLIFQSSGYDSRLMSMACINLGLKDNMLFVCAAPESEDFIKIMEYQGWPIDKYMVYNKNADKEEYYEYGFNYDKCIHLINGPCDFPIQMMSTIYFDLGFDDDNTQLYSNQFAGILKGTYKSFEEYYTTYYTQRYSKFWSVFDCEVVDNYLDFDFMKLMLETKSVGWDNRDKLRADIIRYVDPGMLKFKRWSWKEIHRNKFFKLSNRLYNKAINDYKDSWYYHNVDSVINSTPYYITPETVTWWKKWSMGAFTNYLVKKDININII